MNLPGLALHELTGQRQGTWSVKVSGNWRITFIFEDIDAYNVIAVFSRMRGNKILERLTVRDSNTPHSCDYRYNLEDYH